MLHEFNHSFINPLLDSFTDNLVNSNTVLFDAVKSEMAGNNYGDWKVMFNESLVRAAVIQYMLDHHFDETEIKAEIDDNYFRGFIWIKDLVHFLDNYKQNRKAYSTVKEFMPEIAKEYEKYSKNINLYLEEYDKHRPKILSISEFENGSKNVDPALKKITINFDQEMKGIRTSLGYGSCGKKYYPEVTKVYYTNDKMSVIVEVELEKGQEYHFLLLGMGFKSKDNIPIKDYEISFSTK